MLGDAIPASFRPAMSSLPLESCSPLSPPPPRPAQPDARDPARLRIAPLPDPTPPPEPRPSRPAMWRGWCRRCPACGAGPLMESFLKVRPQCPACGQVLSHHRADDGPAYLTVLIVGHVIAPALLIAFLMWRPDPLILASVSSIACVALSLYLLPRIKGAIVGLQWAQRMHGFGQEPPHPARAPRE